METYDVVVLVSAPRAETVATTLARDGKSVIVEQAARRRCPYFACMPNKAMLLGRGPRGSAPLTPTAR
jgi:pyruvate/2-oxoglutarate dehydrogenase complex dihydrolipoamide dehydrogenase (E3) component